MFVLDDDNRVILEGEYSNTGGDYINASFIKVCRTTSCIQYTSAQIVFIRILSSIKQNYFLLFGFRVMVTLRKHILQHKVRFFCCLLQNFIQKTRVVVFLKVFAQIICSTFSGVKPETVHHFWKMIWQYNINRIVMLSNLVEENKVIKTCFNCPPSEMYSLYIIKAR